MTFDNEVIDKVWNKARDIQGANPNEWKQDVCNTPMKKDDYGNRDSQYGWEIDHKDPSGSDNLSNLQPLQWENNASKGDGELKCKCNKD